MSFCSVIVSTFPITYYDLIVRYKKMGAWCAIQLRNNAYFVGLKLLKRLDPIWPVARNSISNYHVVAID